jgi:hypothetical protein
LHRAAELMPGIYQTIQPSTSSHLWLIWVWNAPIRQSPYLS